MSAPGAENPTRLDVPASLVRICSSRLIVSYEYRRSLHGRRTSEHTVPLAAVRRTSTIIPVPLNIVGALAPLLGDKINVNIDAD